MKNISRFAFLFFAMPTFVLAVYAPIPEQEQGKALTYRVGASTYYDSNIFGAANGEIDSMVYGLSAAIMYNGSVSDQTFSSASYLLNNDYVADRPEGKNLTSHTFNGRLAHSFSQASNIDINGTYAISKNPESLLNGVPVNTDQSLKRGQLDARFTTTLGQKTALVAKYRLLDYNYDSAQLAYDLNRTENLAGLELAYAFLPETKLVGEYRYQTIGYDSAAALKDKTSNFLMGGVDYSVGKQTLLSARAGFEDRERDSAGDTNNPYVELTARYTYAEGSFLSSGYVYTLEEPSDVLNYTDSKVNRFFVNVQHRLTGSFTASGSLTYEPSELQGRGVHRDDSETTTRLGLGLSWQPTKNWTATTTYDLDNVNSDVAYREQKRSRFGVSARYTF